MANSKSKSRRAPGRPAGKGAEARGAVPVRGSRNPARGDARPRGGPDAGGVRAASLVAPADLRWSVDPASLGFSQTDEIAPQEGVHAQERALEAIRVGLSVDAPGYNIFCVGLIGSTRMATVQKALAQLGPRACPAPDRCFVMDFRNPEAPRLLELPRGMARPFQRDVDELIDQLVKHLGLVFEEDRFAARIRAIRERHGAEEREILDRLHDAARDAGFVVVQTEGEEGHVIDLAYRLRTNQIAISDLERLVDDARAGVAPPMSEDESENESARETLAALDIKGVRAAYEDLAETLRRTMVEARRIARSLHREIGVLEREESLVVVDGAVREFAARYATVPGLRQHLDDLRIDVLDHLELFKRSAAAATPAARRAADEGSDDEQDEPMGGDAHTRYRVNVVLDNEGRNPCPVVVESSPTARNLLGTIVSMVDSRGRPRVDHRSIRPGSLLEADGGWLLLDAADVLAEPDTWRTLKRVLLERRLDLRDAVGERGQPAGLVLRPQQVPLNVKVVMVGPHEAHDFMDGMDVDFKHVFKIRAEFDWIMDRKPENIRQVGACVQELVVAENLPPFTAEAVAALAEHAARLAEQQGKMVSQFDQIAEPARQAGAAARGVDAPFVDSSRVHLALEASERRCSLGAERVHEAIQDERIIIDTTGRVAGQINGLAVVSTIEHAFGYPVRITAVVSHGSSGVINVEREVRLSGSLHDKGMFILEGYLAHVYGRDFPLAFSASIALEQLYGGIEGDSASSAEIYALLSALSGLPLEQGIAVTGSVNQVGEIQPVGGINEKIEGFHDACAGMAGGPGALPGHQGVIMPRANVGDLMLRRDVVDSCRLGRFHVWAIASIDEGLEILTGLPAGSPGAKGRYAKGTVHCAVLERLRELSLSHHGEPGGRGPTTVHHRDRPAPAPARRARRQPEGRTDRR